MTQIELAQREAHAKQWRDALVRDILQSDSLVEWLRANIGLVVECETEIALLELAAELERDGVEPCVALQVASYGMVRRLIAPPSYGIVENCLDTLQRESIIRLVRKYRAIPLEDDV